MISLYFTNERNSVSMNKIKEYIKREIFYAGMSQEEYRQILSDIQKENRKSLMSFSAIAFVFLLVMFVLSFVACDVKNNRWVYMIIMAIMGIIFVIANKIQDRYSNVLLVDVYAFVSILFVFGIILGTVTRPDEQTVTFVALLLTAALLFPDKSVRLITCKFLLIMSLVITALYDKLHYVLVADIIDVTVFGIISAIISTYMMRVKCQRFLYAQKVSILSETDLLTGLCNRNSYEQNLSAYSSMCDQILACIYVDVNGLHEMNNTKGHEAGDKMLQFVGKTLQKEFGKKNTFRIGGDEFVALVTDESEEVVQKKIARMRILVEEKSYHIAVGYSIGNCSETDVSLLISSAEKRMYEAKNLFYQQKNMNREITTKKIQKENAQPYE